MPQDFDDFLIKEYDRISEAHFSTMTAIAQFMRLYLAVASVPPAAIAFLAKPAEAGGIVDVLRNNPSLALVPLLAISIVGILLAGYVISLQNDAALYARTVNGVRAHFVDKAGAATASKAIVLPTDRNKPSFFSTRIYFVLVPWIGDSC